MIFKCKMCGGDIIATEGASFGTCDSCGSTSTLPRANEERIVNLFNRANHFRRQNEFDKAMATYENILEEDPKNAEAHWGVVLCRYGIEYVEDPKSGKRIPTCHRVQRVSILSDADYIAACENAHEQYTKELYQQEAKTIADIQKGILAIADSEDPYDIFICYKETAESGGRTIDSTLAQDLHFELEKDGFKVFFARITLEDKLGRDYEPYIFNALNTAKVMLAIGTKREHFEATWVKNEWSRFLALMKDDRSRLLIPCYRDMDAYDIPDELSHLQAQDMGKIGFAQDLLRGISKVLKKDEPKPVVANVAATVAAGGTVNIESLMKRAWILLEDGDKKQATDYFNKVLDIDPEYAPAYIGKMCAGLGFTRENQIVQMTVPLTENGLFQRALKYADEAYRATLEKYADSVVARIAENERIKTEEQRIEEEKRMEAERLEEERRKKQHEEELTWRAILSASDKKIAKRAAVFGVICMSILIGAALFFSIDSHFMTIIWGSTAILVVLAPLCLYRGANGIVKVLRLLVSVAAGIMLVYTLNSLLQAYNTWQQMPFQTWRRNQFTLFVFGNLLYIGALLSCTVINFRTKISRYFYERNANTRSD